MSLSVRRTVPMFKPIEREEELLRSSVAAAIAVFSVLPAFAEECHFASEGEGLYFVTPGSALVERQPGLLPYACMLLSAGTGMDSRGAACSDGFEGSITWSSDTELKFRDRQWTEVCTN